MDIISMHVHRIEKYIAFGRVKDTLCEINIYEQCTKLTTALGLCVLWYLALVYPTEPSPTSAL